MKPEQMAALREPFPPHLVGKLPKGGRELDFVGHGAVTDRLLAVDPEWSWEPFALDANGLPALDEFGNLWIRLTIGGVTRPGVGDGPNMKERIGDAIRNAGMRFGVALDLWIRGHGEDFTTQEQTRRPSQPSGSNEKRDLVVKLGDEGLSTAGDVETLRARWAEHLAKLDGGGEASRGSTSTVEPSAKRLARAASIAAEAGLSEADDLAARAKALAERSAPAERERADIR